MKNRLSRSMGVKVNEQGRPGQERLSQPLHPLQACKLLLKLRVGTTLARTQTIFSRKKKAPEDKRQATKAKQKGGWLLPLLFGCIFFYQGFFFSVQGVTNIVERVGEDGLATTSSFLLSLLIITVVLMNIGLANKDINKPDSDMSWLLTLPVSSSAIRAMKITEHTFTNIMGWIAIWPLLVVLCWHYGLRWSAPAVGLVIALPTLAMTASLRVLIEVAARGLLPRALMKNAQAAASIMATLLLVLVMVTGFEGNADLFIWDWLREVGTWRWFPLGGATRAAAAFGGSDVLAGIGIYASELIIVGAVAWWALRALDAGGPSVGRGQLQGRRRVASTKRSVASVRGVIGKELLLLRRDRGVLTQAVILPVVLIGVQVLINPEILEGVLSKAHNLGVAVFVVGAYVAMMSTATLLVREGPSLWVLYTLPQSLERSLIQKTLTWLPFALAYGLVLWAYGAFHQGASLELLRHGAYAATGIVIYTMIGGALGVSGTDPSATERAKRLRPRSVYVFYLLAGLYVAGFYSPDAQIRLVIFASAIAVAFWQNVGRNLPYLLDPSALPPATLRLSDGLMAVVGFFALQMLAAAILQNFYALWPAVAMAFAVAGLIVVLIALYVLRRRGVVSLSVTLGLTAKTNLGTAVREFALWGTLAALVAGAWSYLVGHWAWLGEEVAATAPSQDAWMPMTLIAVIAAPIFEEIIFRGFVFRGLRTTYGFAFSVVLSAGFFSAVHLHPLVALVPVFLLGVCTALAFERSRSIFVPILVHALYNGLILFAAAGPEPIAAFAGPGETPHQVYVARVLLEQSEQDDVDWSGAVGRLDGHVVWLDLRTPATHELLRRSDSPISVLLDQASISNPDVRRALETRTQPFGILFQNATDDDLEMMTGFRELRVLDVATSDVSDAGLASLRPLRELERLYISLTHVSDAGLVHLREMRQLRVLNASGPMRDDGGITGSSMATIGQIESLEELDLSGNDISDEGFGQLRGLRRLVRLDVGRTQFGDLSMEIIAHNTNLEALNLADTHITDAGLAHISALSNLRDLEMSRTSLSDEGLVHLSTLGELRSLRIVDTQVTNRGMRHLVNLPALRSLAVDDTAVTSDGEADFSDQVQVFR